MATELSFRQAFDGLSATLNAKNLGWVVAQVQEQIRLGRPVSRRVKELKVSQLSAESSVRFRRHEEMTPGRAVEYRGTVAYTDAEQLRLLLSAIHYAIVSTAKLATSVTHRFPGIIFVSEQSDHRFAVSDLEQENRLRVVTLLERSMAELSTQV